MVTINFETKKFSDIVQIIENHRTFAEDINICLDIRLLQDQLESFGFKTTTVLDNTTIAIEMDNYSKIIDLAKRLDNFDSIP
jgi:hypothetical protein